MTDHHLHEQIGYLLQNDEYLIENKYIVEYDPACGGDHKVSMFCISAPKREFHFSNTDILIIKGNKIRVMIEIEESKIEPVHIMGKFLGNALSQYHIYNHTVPNISCSQESTLFIQVCDTKHLQPGSLKREQLEQIEMSINKIIPNDKMKIIEYRMIYGTVNDFDGAQGKAMKAIIKEFLSK